MVTKKAATPAPKKKVSPKKVSPKKVSPTKVSPKKVTKPAPTAAPKKAALPTPKQSAKKAAAKPLPKRPLPKRVKLKDLPGDPARGSLYLHWCVPSDFDRMLVFYQDELLKTPDYIAHPELREGIKHDPILWTPVLQQAVIATLQGTFAPHPAAVVKAALLLRHEGPIQEPTTLGMFRVLVRPDRTSALLDLLVATKHRRQGHGTRMVSGLVEMLRDLRCTEMSLTTPLNYDGAEEFLRKMGLQPCSVLWAKPLPPKEPTVTRQDVGGFKG